MKSKPVIIQYPKSVGNILKGAMFECPTPAVANRIHPEAKIVRYVDGENYVEAPSRPSKSKSKTVRKNTTARTRKVEPITPADPTPNVIQEDPQNAPESPTANATAEVGS